VPASTNQPAGRTAQYTGHRTASAIAAKKSCVFALPLQPFAAVSTGVGRAVVEAFGVGSIVDALGTSSLGAVLGEPLGDASAVGGAGLTTLKAADDDEVGEAGEEGLGPAHEASVTAARERTRNARALGTAPRGCARFTEGAYRRTAGRVNATSGGCSRSSRDTCRFEGGHPIPDTDRRINEQEGKRRSAALTEPEIQIE